MTTDDLCTTIAEHFRAPARQDVIRALFKLPNFFEGWFTAETLFALRTRWPSAELKSNASYAGFEKPDVVFVHDGFIAVLALKHIATSHREAPSRWDGAKGSTVAKDIEKLRAAHASGMERRVMVFYGPGFRVVHSEGATCDRKRLMCVACSVQHLSGELLARGGERLAEPAIETLLEDGSFHLLDFVL